MNARHAKVNMATLTEFNKTYKPFLHDWAVDITKKHEEIHWTEDEADLSEDVSDWKLKLDEGEKEFITNILRLLMETIYISLFVCRCDRIIPNFSQRDSFYR